VLRSELTLYQSIASIWSFPPISALSRHLRCDSVSHFSYRWQDSKECELAAIDDLFVIDEDLEFSVVPVLELHVFSQIIPYLSRRTGGMQ
jgi:hypothetical protein